MSDPDTARSGTTDGRPPPAADDDPDNFLKMVYSGMKGGREELCPKNPAGRFTAIHPDPWRRLDLSRLRFTWSDEGLFPDISLDRGLLYGDDGDGACAMSMRTVRSLGLTTLIVLQLLPASNAVAQITGVGQVELVVRLTGPGSVNDTAAVAVGGTDLGHMLVHQDRVFFFFGDTFSGNTPAEGGFWRHNTMAWSTDLKPSDGILFDGWVTDQHGRARQVFYSGYQNPITEIPTGGISIGDRMYLWFMSVNWWGPPGEWTINYAGLTYTQDLGQSFTIVDGFRLPASTNFGMVAASLRTDLPPGTDDHVYVWGTPAGRLGGVKLARVLPNSIADPAAYEYFSGLFAGQPTWTMTESAGVLVVPAPVGEMSVQYNPAARRWIMLYLNHDAYAIQGRQAVHPWGPWSPPLNVVSGSAYPGLYGSFMNPVYVENHGETLYFTMSLWASYDVYLMRVRLNLASRPCPADLNLDGVVDDDDFAMFQPCMSGPSEPYGNLLACAAADLDHDGDVDQADFGLFQRCRSGTAPAAPDCAD
jgi:hypothetical protein